MAKSKFITILSRAGSKQFTYLWGSLISENPLSTKSDFVSADIEKRKKRLQCFLKCLLQKLETLTHAQRKEFSFVEET